MTQPDKLFSKEELEAILPDNDIRGYDRIPYPLSHVLVRQLLDSMREVERLKKRKDYLMRLSEYFEDHYPVPFEIATKAIEQRNKESAPFKTTPEDMAEHENRVRQIIADAPSKHPVPCATCGKPMEDRGAEKQWCAECLGKRSEPGKDVHDLLQLAIDTGLQPGVIYTKARGK